MSTQKSSPVIGLTLGDPAGIGPEIVGQAVEYFSRKKNAPHLRLIGSTVGVKVGTLSKISAQHALDALEESALLLRTGEIAGVVNAPVHKANLMRVGFKFPGQTEFYANRAGFKADDVTMMLASPQLRVSLITTHCSLKQAIRNVTVDRILQTTRRTIAALQSMGILKPRIAVCGLNPHAGEDGAFGDEEEKIIAPAVKFLKKIRNVEVSGPHVPDAIFRSAVAGKYDAVICMFHDQGLIPLKLIGFDEGVNLTLGLPFWRGAPDHGTALDIAGKGIASAGSLICAIEMVHKLILSSKLRKGPKR